jgi:hypothetical protein
MAKPRLAPDVLRELNLHGLDAMRDLLASSTDGHSGTGRNTAISLGNISVTRGQMQGWVNWKTGRDACWMKVGVIAAIAAAGFSLLGVLLPLLKVH